MSERAAGPLAYNLRSPMCPAPHPSVPAAPPAAPLTASLPGHGPRAGARLLLGVLPGEGIGPEVVAVALGLLPVLERALAVRFELREGGAIGLPAQQACGKALSDEVVAFCDATFAAGGALFCGPGGGRFVYELRQRFDLYCKLTPIQPLPALDDTGPLRPQLRAGVDLVVVRENTGGLYLGEDGIDTQGVAHHRFTYTPQQVERILRVAAGLAASRRGRMTVVLKPGGVPAISRLWQQVLARLPLPTGLQHEVLEVDNAMYQLLAQPARFDVVVAPNMFGDVLSDGASLLLGSRGLSFSGNFGPGGRAAYQTGHGAARDLAGTDRANPIGQVHALAMLLRESLGLGSAATAVEQAVAHTLAAGWRTPDIATASSRVVGTAEMGARLAESLARQLASRTA